MKHLALALIVVSVIALAAIVLQVSRQQPRPKLPKSIGASKTLKQAKPGAP